METLVNFREKNCESQEPYSPSNSHSISFDISIKMCHSSFSFLMYLVHPTHCVRQLGIMPVLINLILLFKQV